MSENNHMQEGSMNETTARALERLREEITILRIEGTLICFDKHEAKRRTGVITNMLKDADGTERPVSIEIHPSYGQPSVLAYKIMQAIFLKITEGGEPYSGVVVFTQRELARLTGRSWGGNASRQIYHAIMQLRRTGIMCHVRNKETKESLKLDFQFLSDALFSSREQSITEC